MRIRKEVASSVVRWIRLLTAEVRRSPGGDIHSILASPALSAVLGQRLGHARSVVDTGMVKAWPSSFSPYRASLVSDIGRAYGEAPDQLWEAVVSAFESVPQEDRAAAVYSAATSVAWNLGLRNELTVEVAQTRREGEEVLSRAGQGWEKKWVTREDPQVCEWCRILGSLPVIPVDQEFPYGDRIGNRMPPRVYLDLLSPPRHPRCRCRIRLVREDGVVLSSVSCSQYPLFMMSGLVRDDPESSYQSKMDFLSVALLKAARVGVL